jgi:hypothetical protein
MKSEAMRRLIGEGTQVEVTNAPEGERLDAVTEVAYSEVTDDGLTMDLSGLECGRGDEYAFGAVMEAGAWYTFTFEGSCQAQQLAQVPVTFFCGSIPLAVMVWNGTGGRNIEKKVRFMATSRSNVFRLRFGQNGVKLSGVRVTKNGPLDVKQYGLVPEE